MIDNAELLQVFEGAFKPLRCVATLSDYDRFVGLRVEQPGGGKAWKREGYRVFELANNPHALDSTIRSLRRLIEESGISLDPWSLQV